MLFKFGIFLALLSGVTSREFFKKFIKSFRPEISYKFFDFISIFLLICGLIISSTIHFEEMKDKSDQQEYADIAQYNWHGFTTSDPRGGGLSTIYSDWYRDIENKRSYLRLVRQPKNGPDQATFQWDCDQVAIDYYLKKIKEFKRFPFPYVLAGTCLHNNNDNSWKQYSLKAEEILQKVSKFSGPHNKIYKYFLQVVENDLSKQ